jgi:hypothetical protein
MPTSYMNSKSYSSQESQDSSVSVVSDTGWLIGVRFPARGSSYPMGTDGSLPSDKAAGP